MIVAAVVCGPGSILTSSKIGAQLGYRAVWVLVAACFLMVAMVSLATRVGVTFKKTPCGEIADRLGRPVAAIVGIVMFLIIAAFQSSNNIAIAAALEAFDIDLSTGLEVMILLLVNVLVIIFLYSSRKLYSVIELSMKILVLLMVVAFMANCIMAKPSLLGAVKGLVPTLPGENGWLLVALIGTTFSVAAAFYQAYLVREKQWTSDDRRAGMMDSVLGIATLGFISLVIMMTNAAIFYGKENAPELKSAVDVAVQLKPLFGVWAQVVFGIGIFAGAISSFLVNALIGGHILADGLGLGDRIASKWTRHFTTLALLTGMVVGVLSISTGLSRVTMIVIAQALTVVGVPALALALIYLGVLKHRENRQAVPRWILAAATAGLITTSLIAARTVHTIIETVARW